MPFWNSVSGVDGQQRFPTIQTSADQVCQPGYCQLFEWSAVQKLGNLIVWPWVMTSVAPHGSQQW